MNGKYRNDDIGIVDVDVVGFSGWTELSELESSEFDRLSGSSFTHLVNRIVGRIGVLEEVTVDTNGLEFVDIYNLQILGTEFNSSLSADDADSRTRLISWLRGYIVENCETLTWPETYLQVWRNGEDIAVTIVYVDGSWNTDDRYARIAKNTVDDGGLTVTHNGAVSVKSGFAVSAHKEHETIVQLSDFTPEHVRDFIAKHADILAQPNRYFGSWVDGNRVYLDITTVTDNESLARMIGQHANQLAIFDLDTFEEIRL